MILTFHITYMTTDDLQPIEDTFASGEPKVIDINDHKKQLLPIIKQKLLDMKIGEESDYFIIKAKDAFGSWDKKAIQKIPKDKFPKEIFEDKILKQQLLENGLAAESPNGEVIPIKVLSINKKTITADMNHPLVDKDLKVKLKLLNKEIVLNQYTKQYLHIFTNVAKDRFEEYLEALYYSIKNDKLILTAVIDNLDVKKMSKKELKNSIKKILTQIVDETNHQLKTNIQSKVKVKFIGESIKEINQIYKRKK